MSKKIYNLIVLDESGSMGVIKESIIEGFRTLAHKLISIGVEMPNQEHFISLVTFNGMGIKNRLNKQPVVELAEISHKSYVPDSTTPLYDAICKSVLMLKHDLHEQEDYAVLVTVITDGVENASTEFTQKETKLLIENMSKDPRWGFGLIGAGIDLQSTAGSLSIPIQRTLEFERHAESVKKMFNRYANAQHTMSSVMSCHGNFHDDDVSFK